jgi:hypothetical protein
MSGLEELTAVELKRYLNERQPGFGERSTGLLGECGSEGRTGGSLMPALGPEEVRG